MTTSQTFKNTLVILLTLLIAYGLVISARIIIVLLIAIIVASAIRPLINNKRIPIGLSIVAVYLTIAVVIGLITVAIMPPIVNQVTQYIENDARLATRIIVAQRWVESAISDVTNSEVSLVASEEIRAAVSDFAKQTRRVMPSVLDNIGATLGDAILFFVMGAYWLTSHTKATEFVTQLSPPKYREKTQNVIDEIENTLGGYVRGVVLLASIVALLYFIPLQVIGVPNAITLAVILSITSIIPMIGSLIGIALAVAITLVISPQSVLIVIVVALIVEQIKSYYLGPKILSSQINLDPLLIIVYTAIGFVMLGIVGALIAVPIMGTVHILLTHLIIEPYKDGFHQFQMEHGLHVMKVNESSQTPVTPHKDVET